MANFNTLLLAHEDRVTTLTLNRPEKRNAVSFELVQELMRALDEVEHSGADVLIITGAGKAFCSGLDLDDLKALLGKTHEANLQDSATMARLFRRIYDFPLATIAAGNSAANPGGT